MEPWTKFWKEGSQPNMSLDTYFAKKNQDAEKIEDMDESELSQMEDLQSTGTKRIKRNHITTQPLWSSAISLKQKFITLSELEGGKFLHTLLELSQQFDHQDVANSSDLPCKAHEELKHKCDVSFRG